MPLARKRPATREPQSSDEESASPEPATQTNTQRQHRLRASPSESEDDDSDGESNLRPPSSTDVMVKKLVRLALSSEYSRQPIRRVDVTNKVLGEGSRQFKVVFEGAQKVLAETFGMQLSELPQKEKVTIQQRRAAQKVERASTTSKSWILTSTLPSKYRKQDILRPTRGPAESSYTGLYTFIIAVILLNGGALPEQKLERYLSRMNADSYTPVDRTDRLLLRLCKEGYLVKNREMDVGDEVIEYMVGPRGKVEVGTKGVAGLVREVYGRQAMVEDDDITPAEMEKIEEFEFRLARSLGIKKPNGGAGGGAQPDAENNGENRPTQRRRREADSSDDSDN